ncbi:MAG: DUF1634 domain-containing protein [Candidatus Sulfotelmatobacter sp.]
MKNHASNESKRDTAEELSVYADVYKVLLGGMLLSTGLFVIGIVRALLRPQFVPLTTDWIKQHYHWRIIVQGIRSFDPTVIMMIATVLLILTPVVRVIVSMYAFAVDGDRKFVAVTFIVLLVIGVTVVLGLFGLK